MPRRYRDPFYGARFIGDRARMFVHDCDNEARGDDGCGIGVIDPTEGLAFEDATAARSALVSGFTACPHCLGDSAPDDAAGGRYSSSAVGGKPMLPE